MKENKIREYFDEMSIERDLKLRNPILKYEQDTRQKAVIEMLIPTKGELILDVGCGNGRDIIIFANNSAFCVGIDFSSGMIKEGKKAIDTMGFRNVHLISGGATNLPFSDGTFDKISCSEVIEHIPDWEKAIAEMNRVLKIGGKLVITTPNWYSLYGFTRKLFDLFSFILRKKSVPSHPYDEWKTQKEVINVLKKHGIEIDRTIGICFIPGHLTYSLPKGSKEMVVKLSSYIEKMLKNKLTGKGYMIGISAIKK